MKNAPQGVGLAVCGITVYIAVALATVALSRWTGSNLFSLTVWAVIPAGAIFTGLVAASGYYLGSLLFPQRVSPLLLIQMVIVASVAQWLLYWFDYATLTLENGSKVSDVLPFKEYMDLILTKSHYKSGRSGVDQGEVGQAGYLYAAIQYIGFLLGGAAVFLMLLVKPACTTCNVYLKALVSQKKLFANHESASSYYDRLFTLPMDGPDFSALIRAKSELAKPTQGSLQIQTRLLSCPCCKAQAIEEKVQGFNGKQWKSLRKLDRLVRLPEGTNLTPVFRP